MKNEKKLVLSAFFFFGFSCVFSDFERIGHLEKMAMHRSENIEINSDKTLRTSKKCYFSKKRGYGKDFINDYLNEMTNGNPSIIGYRDLIMEYKSYPIGFSYFGGFVNIDCITFSGYAILKKESSKTDFIEN